MRRLRSNERLVVFRAWRDRDVLALFPLEDGGNGHCMAYERVGQHGAADYFRCIRMTRPATPSGWKDLADELRKYGDGGTRLVVRRRMQRDVTLVEAC